MQHTHPAALETNTPAAALLSPGDYVQLLHTPASTGKPTVMVIDGRARVHCRTCDVAAAPFIAEATLDASSYLSLNRFFGPRGVDRLAALNALYLDLDIYRISPTAPADWAAWTLRFGTDLAARGLPAPSVLLHTGRGLAAIWLLEPLPRHALPRWRETMKALIALYRKFGADPACSDASRVFRLPGTMNLKSGSLVKIIGGTLRRYGFDDLSDRIFVAQGRPTRKALKDRKKGLNTPAGQKPRGLSPWRRFQAIERDLERLRIHWGHRIPEGLRNIWLHLLATCLTHTAPDEIEARILLAAAEATPGLGHAEVKALIGAAIRRGEADRTAAPLADGRLHYAGATIADMLGVSDQTACTFGLEQVFSVEERARRKASRQRQRRAAAGAIPREDWRAQNAISRDRPWAAEGISRATWYRRQRRLPKD